MISPITKEQMEWLLADGDRCASVVADAYEGWDAETPWADWLAGEIEHQKRNAP